MFFAPDIFLKQNVVTRATQVGDRRIEVTEVEVNPWKHCRETKKKKKKRKPKENQAEVNLVKIAIYLTFTSTRLFVSYTFRPRDFSKVKCCTVTRATQGTNKGHPNEGYPTG